MNRDLFFQAANARGLERDRLTEVWSVSQVNAAARELLEGALPLIWVAGEVSGFKRYPSGHCYFTLKDRAAQLGCVMWRDQARGLPAQPPEGMEVHAFGYLTIYPKAGRYQFVVRRITARGEGLWRIALEKARARLAAEGLLDPARKRPLPDFPACLGVVTSPEGAALRDIVSVLRRRARWIHVLVYPTRVQGERAETEIAAAIRRAGRSGRVDTLIVGRGGGSLEDLQAFNDERVARAIAESPVPVISAVGHETDITLTDLVADVRAPTPSAAAELAVPDGERLRADLAVTAGRMASALRNGVGRNARRVERLEERLTEAMAATLRRRRLILDGLRQRLDALGPRAVLERGFALALDDSGRILRSVESFEPGLRFTLRLKDGRVVARAEEREE
ncbi:MAG: exodeoxyribonuclease VII large subunit [Gemmatimonadetes bacterium]|uniref:Exodeoxyribonuclease 7 large subunit n=1 Tax=Candidatus Kutchimonas denitrificans TaxID=3056748 RepID=A0AAE5CA50_9BACT|nr:exodeoxyribonuclease VII large subunit [Gemmatimonadota bacterium]NIR74177.1 exodeoxyribonuclease VII large subunit [Candidatus Kutchimonas denitrificans]NIR99799.1 exodeoxyribonuclease VII large subunit [Gemmatimonadota bacterium]NIT65388.1 exodeoxyribonuclease VII large subunit [Gemmatimonadota bacterium]NIU51754.1 exodeoxyribonuclease VII large subunit [Gemmatimonadota bacterium]